MNTTLRVHPVDLASVPVGNYVIVETTVIPIKPVKRFDFNQVKTRYIDPGAFEHCTTIARAQAFSKPANTWVSQAVSETQYYAVDQSGLSITWEVKRVIAKKSKSL